MRVIACRHVSVRPVEVARFFRVPDCHCIAANAVSEAKDCHDDDVFHAVGDEARRDESVARRGGDGDCVTARTFTLVSFANLPRGRSLFRAASLPPARALDTCALAPGACATSLGLTGWPKQCILGGLSSADEIVGFTRAFACAQLPKMRTGPMRLARGSAPLPRAWRCGSR